MDGHSCFGEVTKHIPQTGPIHTATIPQRQKKEQLLQDHSCNLHLPETMIFEYLYLRAQNLQENVFFFLPPNLIIPPLTPVFWSLSFWLQLARDAGSIQRISLYLKPYFSKSPYVNLSAYF